MKTITIKKDEELLVTLFLTHLLDANGKFTKEQSIVYQILPRPFKGNNGEVLGYILDVSLLMPGDHSDEELKERTRYLASIQLGMGSIKVLGAPNVCSTQT